MPYQAGHVCMPTAQAAAAVVVSNMAPTWQQSGPYESVCAFSLAGTAAAPTVQRSCTFLTGPAAGSPVGPPTAVVLQPLPCGELDQPAQLQLLGVDASTVGLAFGWGFSTVIFFWFAGYVVGIAKSLIKSA
jgi:hypothetical protein